MKNVPEKPPVRPSSDLTMDQFNAMREKAKTLIAAGFLPASLDTPEKVISVAMAGRELGIGFMASLRNVYPIGGLPTISPRLMLAMAIKTGELLHWKIEDVLSPTQVLTGVQFTATRLKEGGEKVTHAVVFGDKEATALKLIDKDNYKKQKKTMYKWRSTSMCLNFLFPDVLMGGIYTPEELGATVIVSDDDELEVAVVQQMDGQEVALARTRAAEITAILAEYHHGQLNLMAQELKLMTLHNTGGKAEWVELDDLPKLAVQKPGWIERIHQKIVPIIKAKIAEEEHEALMKKVDEVSLPGIEE